MKKTEDEISKLSSQILMNGLEKAGGTILILVMGFGAFAGFFAFGAGLVFLTVTQAFGVGILTFGGGCFFGLRFGAPQVISVIGKQLIKDLESELSELKELQSMAALNSLREELLAGKKSFDECRESAAKAPITRPAQAESIT